VRELQSLKRSQVEVSPGSRVAVNVTGLTLADFRRGIARRVAAARVDTPSLA